MSDEDRRALERYVAGLPVDPDALAHAVTARAVERTVVVEALLKGLDAPDPDRRLRTAERLAEMDGLDPRLSAQLTVLVDQDDDAEVRAACAATLRTHALPVPGEPQDTGSGGRRLPRLSLALRLVRVLDATAPVVFEALYADEAPALAGELTADGPDAARIVLRGVPPELHGTLPQLRAAREPDALTPIAHAEAPVADDGTVTFLVPAPRDQVERWCRAGAELLVPSDDEG